MKNEEKTVELLAEMIKGQGRLKDEVSAMKLEIIKQGLQTAESSRAILKLADEIRLVAEHKKKSQNLN